MKAKMSKKSTLTITIMACLLAVAVATTIVLAAFSASKDATTTITFSNGVQLKITGASKNEQANNYPDDVMSTGPATLNWNVILTPYDGGTASGDPATTDKTGDVGGANGLDGASKVELAAISMDVAGTGTATIFLAVKPKVSWVKNEGETNEETGTVTVTPASGWTAGEVESDGTWYLKSVQLTDGSISNVAFSAITGIYTPAGTSADNAYAGREYTAQIAFEASTVAIHTAATPSP